jgi:transcriptional regulator of nitric oxide reductase
VTRIGFILLSGLLLVLAAAASAAGLGPAELAAKVAPPYQLGERIDDSDVWMLVNLDGAEAGYLFETEPLAPIPGFSGMPINMLVAMNRQGRLISVEILDHNEPIFVSGLGQAPFHRFVAQYGGRSIYDAMSVGVPYGRVEGPSSQIYLDGVTKATASVRIAHESILAAANAVARRKMRGLGGAPPPAPDPDYDEKLDFDDLVEQGIARRYRVGNRELQELFRGSLWEEDDPLALAEPGGIYLDLWVIDIGPPAVARAVLEPESLAQLRYFLSISPDDEPILLVDRGRHGLVSEAFVRNTEPDLVGAQQDGLPLALRDADLELELLPGLPRGRQIVLRADRRLGFDPTRPWQLTLKAVRRHGSFMPRIGVRDLSFEYSAPARFYDLADTAPPLTPLQSALLGRLPDLLLLACLLLPLTAILLLRQGWLAGLRRFRYWRLGFLAAMTVLVGWYGQGQLSIVTVLGTLRALFSGQSLEFLLFDPFSLAIWGLVLISFVYWGRGFFCGWLCPYGAMQEFSGFIAQRLGVPQLRLRKAVDRALTRIKYLVLLALLAMTAYAPAALDTWVEVEPFKTAVTTYFLREWYFVAYAVAWLLLGMILFRAFCRYVCPLGAVMAIGGWLRLRNWIPRRAECGSRCQLCAVRCQYNAIESSGRIAYDECFQCLDCVSIYHDQRTCPVLVLAAKGKPLAEIDAMLLADSK